MNTLRLFIFILFVMVASCTTDPLVPCEGDGPFGEICREYRYIDGAAIGFVEYEHQADSVLIRRYYSQDSEIQKTLTERYENGRLQVVAAQFPNMETRVESWNYNTLDSLYSIVYGGNDSALVYVYKEGKRDTVKAIHSEELNRYDTYRYYQDDGKLYRLSSYNAQDTLQSYRVYNYFSTGQTRVSFYTSSHQLIGRRVFNFSQLGLITSVEYTDTTGTVTQRSEYIYDGAGKLTEFSETRLGMLEKSLFYYY